MILLVLALGVVSEVPAVPLKIGLGVVDITPPVGWRMCGYFNERLSTGVHDPLQAKAIFLQQDDVQAALVFCDLIGICQPVSDQARRLASQQTGIPFSNLLIAGTHSHTGPLYFDALRTYFHTRAVAQNGKDPQETTDYAAFLVEQIVKAIGQAKAAAVPAKMEAGVVEQTGLSFNRRFHLKDGSVVFNPGKMNPNIIAPAGPIDPDLGILLWRRTADNQTLGLLSNFALHLDTTGGTQYSADYPYYLENELRKTLRPDLVSVFGTGTCGDLNHIDVSNDRPQKGGEETVRIGGALAHTVAKALPILDVIKHPSLAVRSARVEAPLQEFTSEQIQRARARMADVGTTNLAFLEQVEAYKITDVQEIRARTGARLSMEVQVFRLAPDTAIVGLPGEVFVDLGLAIKKASPFKHTLVIELCNDDPGYVPTRKAFAEGSYETVNSRVQPGSGEMLVESAVKLFKDLTAPAP
jgi:neutral ceramidase